MITLTADAQQFLQKHLAKAPEGTLGIRIGLRDYGCSGFGYVVDFTQEKNAEDQVITFDGVQLFVESKFAAVLQGTEIDYVKQGLNALIPNQGFNATLQFNNPNVVKACGCGESFQFKSK